MKKSPEGDAIPPGWNNGVPSPESVIECTKDSSTNIPAYKRSKARRDGNEVGVRGTAGEATSLNKTSTVALQEPVGAQSLRVTAALLPTVLYLISKLLRPLDYKTRSKLC